VAAVQDALDVDLYQRVVTRQRIGRERAGDQDAGIVDQQVQAVGAFDEAGQRMLPFLLLRDVEPAGPCPVLAQLTGQRGHRSIVDVGYTD
jgi:hypothetical protein